MKNLDYSRSLLMKISILFIFVVLIFQAAQAAEGKPKLVLPAIHGEWSLFCEERLIWEKC